MKIVFAYLCALAALGVLDLVWLTLTKGFYMSQIGHLFAPKVTWWAVILFYLLYAAAIMYFVVIGGTSAKQVLIGGAFLGFTAYMTYDLVNLATLQGWPVRFALVDVAWGTCITALAALAAYLV